VDVAIVRNAVAVAVPLTIVRDAVAVAITAGTGHDIRGIGHAVAVAVPFSSAKPTVSLRPCSCSMRTGFTEPFQGMLG
jgi:hypothetical protein